MNLTGAQDRFEGIAGPLGHPDCGQKQVGFEVERKLPGATERTRALGQVAFFFFFLSGKALY